MRKARYLIAGLALAVLLAAGAGTAYATSQINSMMSGGVMDGRDDGMGTTMPSMMGQGDMGSMMGGGGRDDGSMMDSFDKEKPFDLQFIDQMTMHHEGAIMSSEQMISDSKRPELRKLAADIQKNQSEQIDQMKGFRKKWYPDANQTSGMPAGTMDKMMGDGQMEQMMGGSMRQMMGDDTTDEMFLEMMIPHHQMAVDMSEKALKEADHPEIRDLARKIRDEQSSQIKQMKGYLEEIEAANKS
jgi:uncharacterized protein (DUF305 family)